jgi:predicted AlkP superfamily pyrophosphatase or phosphodiesterase
MVGMVEANRSKAAARTRLGTLAAVASGVLLMTGCGAHYVTAGAPALPSLPQPSTSVTRHVVLMSIDGLRPDAIGRFAAPTLQRLVREGSYTLAASTITPSKTLPSHTSMLTGELPERHQVLWNNVATARAEGVELPTIFGVARSHGYRTAAFFSKAKFTALQQPGTLDYSQAPGGWFGRWSSDRTVRDVEAHLDSAVPNMLFVHFSDPDQAGHRDGWMSEAYGRAVSRTDAAVARVLAAADQSFGAGNYSVIVTADHGGHGRDHGSSDPLDVTIPWIAWGQGVKAGRLQDASVRTMDTASTALWLLGLSEPTEWHGSPVAAAFQGLSAD